MKLTALFITSRVFCKCFLNARLFVSIFSMFIEMQPLLPDILQKRKNTGQIALCQLF